MSTNKTPETIRPLVAKATRGLAALLELEGELNVTHNPATLLSAETYDLIGRAADPAATPPIAAIVGKQPRYIELRAAHAVTRALLKQAKKDGREFLGNAVDSLKPALGRRWNSQWTAVGFTAGSLRLPRDPVPTLALMAAHYRAHADHETAARNLTAVKAEQVKAAIVSAQLAADSAHAAEVVAKQERDEALGKLRLRLIGLRGELDELLDDDDARWYRFGFRRPIDGETPDLVEELSLRLGGAGEVIAEWPKARLAVNYRVSWKVTGSTDEPTQVGLVSDPQAVIPGLPHGTNITVIVTARNAAGESAPMEAAIAVP